eukprot:1251596-Pyramimonas_sp.AAC.1
MIESPQGGLLHLNSRSRGTRITILNDSPLKEGFYRPAVASGDWQPTMPAVVEDEEMVGQPASYTELIRQDERDEELREVPRPTEIWGRPNVPRSGARSTSSSNINISMIDTCWNWNSDCAPQAESRCPGKANKPEGACRHPVCKSCSE